MTTAKRLLAAAFLALSAGAAAAQEQQAPAQPAPAQQAPAEQAPAQEAPAAETGQAPAPAAPATEGEDVPTEVVPTGEVEVQDPDQQAAPQDEGVQLDPAAEEPGEVAEGEEVGVEHFDHFPIQKPKQVNWTFDGPFGKFDRQQLQRGFQVYREVCAACHSMNFVAFRHLAEEHGPGFTDEEVKALAASYTVMDGPNEEGEMFERPAIPADPLPAPYPNDEAARVANNGALPPDLSLMAKARAVERGFPYFIFDIFTQYQESGPDYIYSLLTGYDEEPPHGLEVPEGLYYNPYFLTSYALAMPPPISDGQVTYAQNQNEDPADDVPETVDQYSRDVSAFLMWAAEPKLTERKAMGFSVMIFLVIFAGLLYYTKRKVWQDVPH